MAKSGDEAGCMQKLTELKSCARRKVAQQSFPDLHAAVRIPHKLKPTTEAR